MPASNSLHLEQTENIRKILQEKIIEWNDTYPMAYILWKKKKNCVQE